VLQKLLLDNLRELLHAERQLLKALPRASAAANYWQLKTAFEKHTQETQSHLDRLGEAFELLGVRLRATPCKPMRALIAAMLAAINQGTGEGPDLADLALVAAAQRIGHFAWADYSSARVMAEHAGHSELARLLAQNEEEEERATRTLTRIASPILQRAARPGAKAAGA